MFILILTFTAASNTNKSRQMSSMDSITPHGGLRRTPGLRMSDVQDVVMDEGHSKKASMCMTKMVR